MNLEIHPFRLRPHGEKALTLYQAKVRRNWHDKLKHNQGFNISIINETLLQSILMEVLDKVHLDGIREVSTPSLLLKPILTCLVCLPTIITCTKSLPHHTSRFTMLPLRFVLHASCFVLHASASCFHSLLLPPCFCSHLCAAALLRAIAHLASHGFKYATQNAVLCFCYAALMI